MAFENFKPKYPFNLDKYVTKINKTCILKAIWSILQHNKEEKWKIISLKFGPAGLEPSNVSDKGLYC